MLTKPTKQAADLRVGDSITKGMDQYIVESIRPLDRNPRIIIICWVGHDTAEVVPAETRYFLYNYAS